MKVENIEVFLPSKDFSLSKLFYQDLGFKPEWETEELCNLSFGNHSFILQNFYQKEFAESLMLLLTVTNINESWAHIQSSGIAEKYENVRISPPTQQPWGMVIYLHGPAGELWQITEYQS